MSCVEVLATPFPAFYVKSPAGTNECLHVTSAQNAKLCDARAVGLDVLLCLSAINFPLRRLGLVLKATPPLQLAAATLKFVLAL